MLIELIARMSPLEVVNLESKLRELRDHYESSGATKALHITFRLNTEIGKIPCNEIYLEGYKKALKDTQDALRSELIF